MAPNTMAFSLCRRQISRTTSPLTGESAGRRIITSVWRTFSRE